jgi:predicted ABC-type transport system involved in lysophospholipase L1 biosynthesis ATPase subunit
MDRPTEGEVEIDGRNLAALNERELIQYRLKKVGVVFQSFHLIAHRTAFENVELPLTLCGVPRVQRRVAVRDALARVGLSKRMQHRPSQLSGGEQQRVAIARATMNHPKILFADEPTGNLDSKTSAVILDLIREIAKERGTTVLLITHDQTLARNYANRCFELIDGSIESPQGTGATVSVDQRSVP